jgi:hypothetical protein
MPTGYQNKDSSNGLQDRRLVFIQVYGSDTYQSEEWPGGWTYSDDKPEELVDKVIKKIRNTASGQTVPKITLRDNGIYIGKHTVGGREYATAIYSRKKEIGNITKVVVSDLEALATDSIQKHLYCEHTYIKYGNYIQFNPKIHLCN